MPCPVISPTRTGGVLIEWERPPQQLEVEFDPLEPASFVYCHQQTHQTLNGPVTTESVLPLLSRLLMP